MSDSVYSYNLLPDPKPVDTADWAFYTGKSILLQMLSDNRLHITNQSGTPDSYVYTHLQLPAGTYRFGAEVSSPQGAYASNLLRVVIMPRTELTPATWDGQAGRIVTPANTIPEDSTVEFRVMVGPNKNCAVWVRQLFVMSEEDYQQMIARDITWFDGDGIVRGGGFLLAPSVHMWICALWRWSHEQAHHPTRRAAGHWREKLCAHTETRSADRFAYRGGHRSGCGRNQGQHTAQPLRARRNVEHADTTARMAILDDHVERTRGHTRPIQGRHPIGRRQGWHGPLRGDIQHDRRQLQTMAFRSDAARRNGRFQGHQPIQRILSVTGTAVSRLEVAA